MIRKHHRILTITLALVSAISILLPPPTSACGPFFTDAIFVFTKHPDFPLEKFAGGNLGVITNSWARSYLVVAYRVLSGNPLSETEAKAMKSLWDDRLNNAGDMYDESSVKKWADARKAAGATQPMDVQVYRNREKPNEYESFLNCQADAFENATATLNERIKRYQADSAAVREWINAQDIVFSNCGGGKQLPAPFTGADALGKADRAYQIAAANFYSTNFDEAKQQFDAIARDKDSPWYAIAPYLAARSMLRKGSFAEKEDERRSSLADAESRLNVIIKSGELKSSHHAATRLLNLARLRLRPEDKLHELARTISRRDANDNFKQTVWDYTVLMDKFMGDGEEASAQQIPATLASDDLTDWILTLEDSSPTAANHAAQRWEQTKSVTWLVAALATAGGQQAKLSNLLTSAAAADSASPAFPSLTFHSARLLNESGRQVEARALLDKTLSAERQRLSSSALNLFLGQRMMLAQNLDDFLASASRKPAGFSDNNDGREIPLDESEAKETAQGHEALFDLDAANVFNRAMPVAAMKDAARSPILVANLKRDVAQAAFMRAALLDDRETTLQVSALLETFHPELKEFLSAYQRAATPEARRFAAAFSALKFPGLRPFVSTGIGRTTAIDEIDSYRDNYWCAEPPAALGGSASGESEGGKPASVRAPEFLRTSLSQASRQFAALQALGVAPNFFCRVAIEWAEKNPKDPRAPEALHLAVRSTRYGCTDKETGRWSKAAFDLLHRQYPNTTWARNTRYWFKG